MYHNPDQDKAASEDEQMKECSAISLVSLYRIKMEYGGTPSFESYICRNVLSWSCVLVFVCTYVQIISSLTYNVILVTH